MYATDRDFNKTLTEGKLYDSSGAPCRFFLLEAFIISYTLIFTSVLFTLNS